MHTIDPLFSPYIEQTFLKVQYERTDGYNKGRCCLLLLLCTVAVFDCGGYNWWPIMTGLSMEQKVYVGVFSEENETRLSSPPVKTGGLGLNTAPEASTPSGNTVPRAPTRTLPLMKALNQDKVYCVGLIS